MCCENWVEHEPSKSYYTKNSHWNLRYEFYWWYKFNVYIKIGLWMQPISFTKLLFDRSVRICTWIQSSMNFDVLPNANLYFAFVMVNKNKLHIQSEDPFKNLWLIKYKFWQIWIPSFFLSEKKRYKDECNIVKENIYIIMPFLNNSVKIWFQ